MASIHAITPIYMAVIRVRRFGNALSLKPSLRDKIEIVTKCGIVLQSKNRPSHKSHHYDTSKTHIIRSVDQSLMNLKTDYIDLLLIHRPDPLMDPAETAGEALTEGIRKVRNFEYFRTSKNRNGICFNLTQNISGCDEISRELSAYNLGKLRRRNHELSVRKGRGADGMVTACRRKHF